MAETTELVPVCAFDLSDGTAVPLRDSWPALTGPGAFRWLHLDLTHASTRTWISEHCPEIAAAHLLQAETRPRFHPDDSGLLLNLRGVNMNEGAVVEDMVSIRLWVTDGAVVSGRMRKVFAIDDLRRDVEAGRAPRSIGGLLVRLARGLTDRIEAVSLKLEDEVDALEDRGEGDIATLRARAIKLRRYVGPQRDALEGLVVGSGDWLDPLQRARMRDVANRAARIVEELDASRDRLLALQDAIDAEAREKLSQNNYVLAIVAAIFLPLSFLTGLFGVNVGGMPGTDSPLAFAILSVALVALGGGLVALFKFWRWF